MPILIAGVDGGQSSTTAAVAQENGPILGRGTGPPADLVGEQRGSQRQQNAVAAALAAARREAGFAPDSHLSALVVGLTGHDAGMPLPAGFDAFADAVAVVHDTVIAHAGAFGGDPGIIVLAGTGSVALGNAQRNGPFVRAGGWGYFFGDAGSALWVAREAISWAMRDADNGYDSELAAAARRFFDLPDLRAIQHAFAAGTLTRPALAAFAAEVLSKAPEDSPSTALGGFNAPSMPLLAYVVRNWAIVELINLAKSVHYRLPSAPTRRLSCSGGLFESEGMRRAFRDVAQSCVPSEYGQADAESRSKSARILDGVEVVEPAGDPLDGAISLARRLLRGEPVDALSYG